MRHIGCCNVQHCFVCHLSLFSAARLQHNGGVGWCSAWNSRTSMLGGGVRGCL